MKQRQLVGLVASAAIVLAGTAMVALSWPAATTTPETPQAQGPGGPPPPGGIDPIADNGGGKPVATSLHTLKVTPANARARSVTVPRRATQRFSLLGLTWADPEFELDGTVQVRTRAAATGRWSGWETLETDGTRGPDVGAEAKGDLRGASEPLWVGPSDGVAARVVGARGSRPLPAGLRLDLIDPYDDPASAGSRSGGQGGGLELGPSDAPSATPSTVPSPPPVPRVALPSLTSRSTWLAGAKDPVTVTPSYGAAVKVVFVHHTADTADGDCAKSAAHVRAIMKFHMESNGWDDIGYNFLVDKCGTLFEGRKGGTDKPVIGAHTYGFNTNSAGVAVLGTYTNGSISDAARKTIAHLAAAKLTQYGFDPLTQGELVEGATDGKFPYKEKVLFHRISGHRDGVNTICPGDALYAQLPGIRVDASAKVLDLKANPPTGGVSAGGKYYVKGKATMAWSTPVASAALAKFELLVDGAAAATLPATARSGAVTVPAGTRRLQVRATQLNGLTSVTPAATVVSDLTAPKVSAPWLGLRGGTVTATAVPATVNFKASDNARLAWVGGTTPAGATLSTTATTWQTAAKPGGAVTFTVAAKDVVGQVGRAAVTRTTTLLPETSAKRTGAWAVKSVSGHLNGKALYSAKKGTKLTFTFTGSSAALIVGRFAKSGKADVYLDGKKVSTIDTKAGKTAYRQALWVKSMASGKHTVSVVVLATKNRPGITVDGLAFVK